MPVCGFRAVIVLVVRWLCFGLTACLRTDGILPCKGCDNYWKSQEKSVKNKKF